MNARKILPYLLVTLAVAMWGVSFVLTKAIFNSDAHYTATIIVFFRLLFSVVIFVPILFIVRKVRKIEKGDLKYFLGLALMEPFLYFLCENTGLQYISSGLASMIIGLIPVFVPFGMLIAYKERLSPMNIVGGLVSLLGIATMILGSGASLGSELRGILLLFTAVFITVFYSLILNKIVDKYPPMTITVYQNVIGIVYFLPLLFFNIPNLQAIHFTASAVGCIAALGVGCSTLSYVFFYYGIRRMGASSVFVFSNATPVFTMIFACAIGQESLTLLKVAGMVVAITGVSIAQIKRKSNVSQ
ncbi:MAG: DMT family transporter [Bacteroidales bacterium]|nr:DMT family transporter [Bacteroidales bacterium]